MEKAAEAEVEDSENAADTFSHYHSTSKSIPSKTVFPTFQNAKNNSFPHFKYTSSPSPHQINPSTKPPLKTQSPVSEPLPSYS